MIERGIPQWISAVIGASPPPEGSSITLRGQSVTASAGVLRIDHAGSRQQGQTRDAFGFKWGKRDTFEGEPRRIIKQWLVTRFGRFAGESWVNEHGHNPILLDAGCGAAMSAIELFGPLLPRLRYVGVDISEAVDVARARFLERGLNGAFIQADLQQAPILEGSVDIIFSEGVLHHTDDTRAALGAVVRYLKRGGHILFYVYRKKGPVREFTDDFIRARLSGLPPEEGWKRVMPLTKLGKALGDLDIEIDVPEAIDLLEIPAGKINLQRLFYWHVFKVYFRPEMNLDEMNHINFDWYAPQNAHRQTPEQVRAWCSEFSLSIEHEHVEEAGITIVARKH